MSEGTNKLLLGARHQAVNSSSTGPFSLEDDLGWGKKSHKLLRLFLGLETDTEGETDVGGGCLPAPDLASPQPWGALPPLAPSLLQCTPAGRRVLGREGAW